MTKKFSSEVLANLLKRLGEDHVDPVAYDTAWVSRIPKLNDLSKPAFPEAMQWLRDHQLPDGSFGTEAPVHFGGNILNTLSAVLAFTHWKMPEDEARVVKGIAAICALSEKLPIDQHELVAFELLFPSLLREAKELDFKLPYHLYEKYIEIGNKKYATLLEMQKKISPDEPSAWWFSLEMLGLPWLKSNDQPLLKYSPNIIIESGLIVGSPAAAAYLLMITRNQGKDIPEIYNKLKSLLAKYNGGMTHISIEPMEVAFSLDFLSKAGLTPSQLKTGIDKLIKLWNPTKGLGFTSEIPDCDDTAVSSRILKKAGYSINLEPLLYFYNGNNFFVYKNERVPSVDVNMTGLDAIEAYPLNTKTQEIINHVVNWVEKIVNENDRDPPLTDKWHLSPFYTTSRAIFPLYDVNITITKRCIDWLISSQNLDGGWGYFGFSTLDESSHVILALSFALKKGYDIPLGIFKKFESYLGKVDLKHELEITLWTSKVLYCPKLMLEATFIGARYALQEVMYLIDIESSLIKISFDMAEIQPNETEELLKMSNEVICPLPSKVKNPNADKANQLNISWIKKLHLCDDDSKMLKANFASGCACVFQEESLEDLAIVANFTFLIATLDDALDMPGDRKADIETVKQALNVFAQIFQGYLKNNTWLHIEFPKFNEICEAFYDIHITLAEKKVPLKSLQLELINFFDLLVEEFKGELITSNIGMDEYLEKRSILTSGPLTYELGLVLRNLRLEENLDSNQIFLELKKCAFNALVIANDLLSLKKELEQNEQKINCLTIIENKGNLGLQAAFDEVVKRYNQEILKMTLLGNNLRKDNKFDKSIALLRDLNYGNFVWTLKSRRYQDSDKNFNYQEEKPKISELNKLLNTDLKNIILNIPQDWNEVK